MGRMNIFTLLRAGIAISSSNIYPMKKIGRKICNSPPHIKSYLPLFASLSDGSGMIIYRVNQPTRTKTRTNYAPLVVL